MPGPDPRKPQMTQQARKNKIGKEGIGNLPEKKKKEDFIIVIDDKYIKPKNFPQLKMNDVVIMNPEKKAKGGRAGFKSGMRVCKLAKKGKGRAYGKNS
jgi:hypothetical protein